MRDLSLLKVAKSRTINGYNHKIAPASPKMIPTINIQIGLAGEIIINKKKIAPIANNAVSINAKICAFSNHFSTGN